MVDMSLRSQPVRRWYRHTVPFEVGGLTVSEVLEVCDSYPSEAKSSLVWCPYDEGLSLWSSMVKGECGDPEEDDAQFELRRRQSWASHYPHVWPYLMEGDKKVTYPLMYLDGLVDEGDYIVWDGGVRSHFLCAGGESLSLRWRSLWDARVDSLILSGACASSIRNSMSAYLSGIYAGGLTLQYHDRATFDGCDYSGVPSEGVAMEVLLDDDYLVTRVSGAVSDAARAYGEVLMSGVCDSLKGSCSSLYVGLSCSGDVECDGKPNIICLKSGEVYNRGLLDVEFVAGVIDGVIGKRDFVTGEVLESWNDEGGCSYTVHAINGGGSSSPRNVRKVSVTYYDDRPLDGGGEGDTYNTVEVGSDGVPVYSRVSGDTVRTYSGDSYSGYTHVTERWESTPLVGEANP